MTVEVGAVEPSTVERLRALEHVLSVDLSGGELVCTCEASPHNLVDILDTLRAATLRSAACGASRDPQRRVSRDHRPRAARLGGGHVQHHYHYGQDAAAPAEHVGLGRSLSHRAFHDVHVYVCESELRRQDRPVPVAVVADEAWDASTFKDVATSLAKEGDDQLLEIHECEDVDAANRALKAGEVAGIYTVDTAGTPKLTLLSSYDSSRASTVLTDRSILETVASSYTQNAELMSQIAQDNPAALADPEAVARACRSRVAPAA